MAFSDKNEIKTIGENLRNLREGLGFSLKQVAEKTGLDLSLLSKMERDERIPTRPQIALLADCYGIDEQLLMFETLSDRLAYLVVNEPSGKKLLEVAEKKVNYLKNRLK